MTSIEDQPPLAWTDDRIAEYDKLTDLLRECESLNSGNNICHRIAKIEGIVADLRKTDWQKPRKSFTSFMLDQIAADVNRFRK